MQTRLGLNKLTLARQPVCNHVLLLTPENLCDTTGVNNWTWTLEKVKMSSLHHVAILRPPNQRRMGTGRFSFLDIEHESNRTSSAIVMNEYKPFHKARFEMMCCADLSKTSNSIVDDALNVGISDKKPEFLPDISLTGEQIP